MSEVLLDVRKQKKYFTVARGTLHAVDGVTFTIERGKTMGVVGESGCGKSTLGRVIIGLLEATDGEVWFEGENTVGVSRKKRDALRQQMQMIFQDPFSSLNPRMSVSEIIGEPLKIYKLCKTKQEYETRIAKLMDTVGLASRLAGAYPHELDGGRRQRIGIARALALEPKFIVCDEPVSALDVSIQAQILNLMQDLQKERNLTYLFITHNLSVVRHISDDILVMYLGRMVEICQAKELFRHRLHPYTKVLMSAIPIPSVQAKELRKQRILLKGELSSPVNPAPGCRFAQRCPYAVQRCFEEEPQLEELMPGHRVACHRAREINGL